MLITYTLAYCSFLSFSMAMNKHVQQMFPHKKWLPLPVTLVRSVGWILFAVALLYCSTQYGAATAMVILLGLSSVAVMLLALLLNYRPTLVLPIALLLIAVTTCITAAT
jgi:hypothetical protein